MRNRNIPTLLRSESSGNPFPEISRLQRNIDQIFDNFLSSMMPSAVGSTQTGFPVFLPQCDIEESESHYLLSLDLPGLSKEDVKIEIRGNQLVISGERKEETTDQKSKRVTERYHGYFERIFNLPPDAEPDKIEANFQNGVLHIVLPKIEAAQAKIIPIGESKSGILEKIRRATGVSSNQKEGQKAS